VKVEVIRGEAPPPPVREVIVRLLPEEARVVGAMLDASGSDETGRFLAQCRTKYSEWLYPLISTLEQL
jgi:hypothetical protein